MITGFLHFYVPLLLNSLLEIVHILPPFAKRQMPTEAAQILDIRTLGNMSSP
ncbi:MAG TPA: hypothetical protein VFH15_06245 [Pyrinomonadaceae bacterium]|nr:hypothetical protein [Pyrinomonadaceae bacterium]